ncbi:MAG: hypothetical protein J7L55_00370 [Desulfurococcales archaeon]|nr:hypothetical protein [Desulfurococcales archaeon]
MTEGQVFEKDLIEKVRAYLLFKRYLNPSLIDFIDQTQSYDYIPEVTRIAEDLGIHASTVWKFMNSLSKKGLEFRGVPNIEGLGAVEISLFFNTYIHYEEVFKPLLREYAPIIPRGTYLKYIVPSANVDQYLNVILDQLGREPSNIIKAPYVVIGKPNMRKHYDVSSRTIVVEWEDLYRMIISLPKESIPRTSHRKKLDAIDLFIIRKLEVTPFNSLRRITELLNKEMSPVTPVNYIRVLRHYRNHIEGRELIRGVRINPLPLYPVDTVPITLIFEGHPTELLRVVRVLTSHPYFPEGDMGNGPSSIIEGFLPMDELIELGEFMERLRVEGIVRSWNAKLLDFTNYRKLALPVKPFLTPPEELPKLDEGDIMSEVIESRPVIPSLQEVLGKGRTN